MRLQLKVSLRLLRKRMGVGLQDLITRAAGRCIDEKIYITPLNKRKLRLNIIFINIVRLPVFSFLVHGVTEQKTISG